MRFTLGKFERLKSRKLIAALFEEGTSVKKYPLKINFLQIEHTSNYPVQAAFSVPKRRFKSAVDRNRIKRLLRETYRKEKFIVYDSLSKPYVIMITYIGKTEESYVNVEATMKKALTLFVKQAKLNQYEEN